MTVPEFCVIQINDINDIPWWWIGDARDEVVERITEDPSPWDRGYSYLLMKFGDEIIIQTDGGEPEDRYFGRDWSWVKGAIEAAYKQGRGDERKRAIGLVNEMAENPDALDGFNALDTAEHIAAVLGEEI